MQSQPPPKIEWNISPTANLSEETTPGQKETETPLNIGEFLDWISSKDPESGKSLRTFIDFLKTVPQVGHLLDKVSIHLATLNDIYFVYCGYGTAACAANGELYVSIDDEDANERIDVQFIHELTHALVMLSLEESKANEDNLGNDVFSLHPTELSDSGLTLYSSNAENAGTIIVKSANKDTLARFDMLGAYNEVIAEIISNAYDYQKTGTFATADLYNISLIDLPASVRDLYVHLIVKCLDPEGKDLLEALLTGNKIKIVEEVGKLAKDFTDNLSKLEELSQDNKYTFFSAGFKQLKSSLSAESMPDAILGLLWLSVFSDSAAATWLIYDGSYSTQLLFQNVSVGNEYFSGDDLISPTESLIYKLINDSSFGTKDFVMQGLRATLESRITELGYRFPIQLSEAINANKWAATNFLVAVVGDNDPDLDNIELFGKPVLKKDRNDPYGAGIFVLHTDINGVATSEELTRVALLIISRSLNKFVMGNLYRAANFSDPLVRASGIINSPTQYGPKQDIEYEKSENQSKFKGVQVGLKESEVDKLLTDMVTIKFWINSPYGLPEKILHTNSRDLAKFFKQIQYDYLYASIDASYESQLLTDLGLSPPDWRNLTLAYYAQDYFTFFTILTSYLGGIDSVTSFIAKTLENPAAISLESTSGSVFLETGSPKFFTDADLLSVLKQNYSDAYVYIKTYTNENLFLPVIDPTLPGLLRNAAIIMILPQTPPEFERSGGLSPITIQPTVRESDSTQGWEISAFS